MTFKVTFSNLPQARGHYITCVLTSCLEVEFSSGPYVLLSTGFL